MKYLYRILRLFFCPHNYKTIEVFPAYWENETKPYRHVYRQECKYCGKPNTYTVK